MRSQFDSDLRWSHEQAEAPWWGAVYRRAFPSMAAMSCVRADGWAQRGGIDRVITLACGRTITVDEKCRRIDYGDIALEYAHRYDSGKVVPGWVEKDLACDFIAYAVVPTSTCYLLPFIPLRSAWRAKRREWLAVFPRRGSRKNNGYTSWTVCVPAEVVTCAIRDSMTITWVENRGTNAR